MTRAAWVVIVLVFVCRAVAAFSLPLTGDEAYYWEWSRRLAFGYADHPPAVAWTIWLFSGLGHGAGFVRLAVVQPMVRLRLVATRLEAAGWSG